MLEKIAAFAKTKAAVALLGVAVVGGGGGAVAVAATTGHLSTIGVDLNSSHAETNEGDHTSVKGLLTGCTGSSVSVKDSDGKSWTFAVTSTTKFNGDVKSDTQDEKAGASTEKPEATEVAGTETGDHSGTSTGDSTAKGTETGDHSGTSTGDHAGSSTGDHAGSSTGDHSGTSSHAGSSTSNDSKGDASSHQVTLAQVCAAANINTRDVQVQGTKTSNGYTADKVTLQGPGGAKGDSTDDSSKGTTSDKAGSSTGSSTAKP